ncbi:hypothetical protein NSX24_15200, partial [Salmonella enterica]|nr:hypothetical protein [Salmonella enterica]MCR2128220.1 hypothetical protein [Salmonella enterica]MCR2272438.1 hypothetical protein [Salmonella enterica]MCR2277278.1 hypothetical protein [Salmonella enterica]MCR2286143.1 hypothetical protein [Salmonella enterica]
MKIITHVVPGSGMAAIYDDIADSPRFVIKGKLRHVENWICPYISRHLLSLNPLLACCRRYSR